MGKQRGYDYFFYTKPYKTCEGNQRWHTAREGKHKGKAFRIVAVTGSRKNNNRRYVAWELINANNNIKQLKLVLNPKSEIELEVDSAKGALIRRRMHNTKNIKTQMQKLFENAFPSYQAIRASMICIMIDR